jgi:allantoicase
VKKANSANIDVLKKIITLPSGLAVDKGLQRGHQRRARYDVVLVRMVVPTGVVGVDVDQVSAVGIPDKSQRSH